MYFRLQMLLLAFVVLLASLAVFGGMGVVAFGVVLGTAWLLQPGWYVGFRYLFAGVLLFAATTVVLAPSVREAREAARRLCCKCPLKQLALAVHNYAARHSRLPPVATFDAAGRPMHSWRVILLPDLYDDLAKAFDMNEPWDGPNNKKLITARPDRGFTCPSDDAAERDGTTTNYVAVVGRNALWQPGKTRSFNDPELQGKLGKTIMLVETTDSGIAWTEPRDFSLDEFEAHGNAAAVKVSSKHFGDNVPRLFPLGDFFFHRGTASRVQVALADSSIVSLPRAAIESPKLKDWLAVGGYDEAEIASLPPPARSIHWTNCIALAVWLASAAMLLRRAWKNRRIA